MLFDPSMTWNHQSWGVDTTVTALRAKGRIRDCIVVGVANIPPRRFAEYYPQRAYEAMPAELRKAQVDTLLKMPPLADRYLKFLVTELKPYVDAHYATLPGRDSTFIMGSSMGGLISLYALCEYPDVFGGAACLSTHTPMVDPTTLDEHSESDGPAYFRDYVRAHLPPAATHRLYMDYGDQTFDKFYPPYQRKLDEVLRAGGYSEANWVTKYFPGENHSETAWAARLHIPLEFLLGP
jgi:enterochelin esterase-like enzyme